MAEYDDFSSPLSYFQILCWLAATRPQPQPQPQAQPQAQQPQVQTQIQTQPQAQPQAEPQAESQAEPQAEPQVQPQAEPQAQTQSPPLTPEAATVGQPQPQFQAGEQLPTPPRPLLVPTRPRLRLITPGQAPRGQIPQPPWRGPNFRPVAGPVERALVAGALRIREAQRNAAAPQAAATRPAAAPQGTQVPAAGTAQPGNDNRGTATPAAAPVTPAPVAPAPAAPEPAVADSRIRETDLIQPLLFVGSVNVGSPVESAWNTGANGLFAGGRPMFGRGIQIGNNDGNNNASNNNYNGGGDGNGSGNGATPPPPPPPPAAAPQDENNNGTTPELDGQAAVDGGNEKAPPAAPPQGENNNGTIPEPEGQTLIGDPNGFWLRSRAIDPEDAGVNVDTQWNPLDDVQVTNNPDFEDGDDVVMMNVDDEIERQMEAQFYGRWLTGRFTQDEMHRYSQGEALSGTTNVTAAALQRYFRRWQREFQAGLTGAGGADAGQGDAPQGFRDV
ncbi:hypothetical protein BC567DRAFT_253197 [Phyllosticta citribraziliensis]